MSAGLPASPEARRPRGPGRARAARAPLAPVITAVVFSALVAVLGVIAAWPIYQTPTLWVVGLVSAALACATVIAGVRLRWGALTLVALVAVFVVILLPLGVPGALAGGPASWVRGLGDGLAAVALGWKQLLTLSLPVGSYQTVLVPLLTIIYGSAAAGTALTLRRGKAEPFAAVFLVVPVLFGAVFGASELSDPLAIGPLTIAAPREIGLWLAAFGTAVAWVAWSSGRDRRAALKRGRTADAGLEDAAAHAAAAASEPGADAHALGRGAVRRNAIGRAGLAAATVAVALTGAFFVAPLATGEVRTVPRDAIDPELVVRDGVSPLASYRAWKRDNLLQTPVFSVTSEDGVLPERLRIAVLSGYDGVDFTVGDPSSVGRFTRFPSGDRSGDSTEVTVQVLEGYSDIWVPIAAPLASPPTFSGPRASELAESFYLNRGLGGAVAVPTGDGLTDGDEFTAKMSTAKDAKLGNARASAQPLIDLEELPELARWLELQELPDSGDGVAEGIERLRERGYLSHSLTDGAGEGAWLTEVDSANSVTFVSSTGGHSETRLEQLFKQLSDQQLAAGSEASPEMLVAGIGNDEQFAAAAALVARSMGFDSRVVVGVRLGGSGGSGAEGADGPGVPGIPACDDVCTGEHLAAWVEVRGSDGVWAPFDVSPQIEFAPTMLEKGERMPEFPTQPEERDATEADPPVGMTNQDGGNDDVAEQDALSALWPVLRTVGLSLLALVLLALPVLFIPLVKRLRKARRFASAVPEERALGAWDELLDAHRDSGVSVPQTGGRAQVMANLEVDGGEWIAWTVDQAVFAREGIDEATAETLWTLVNARVAERRAAMSFWQRLRARFSIASFGGFMGSKVRGLGRGTKKKESLR